LIRLLHAYFPARTLLLGISEACLVSFAFVMATVARLGASDATLMLNYEQGFFKISVVAAAFIICMYYFDLYDSSVLTNHREVITRVIQVLGTVCILLAVLYYLYPPLELGRGIFLIGFILVSLLLLCWRRLFLMINSLPRFAERALIFGDGPLAGQLLSELRSHPEFGLRVVAQISEEIKENSVPPGPHGAASVEELAGYVERHRVNRIIIAMGDRRGRLPVEQLLSMKGRGIVIQDGTDLYETITGKIPTDSLRLGWLLFSPGFHVSRALLAYKRLVSMLVSLVGLLLCLPIIPLIALAVKLASPGPVLYRQKRVGRDGSVFDCLKFRTMYADAEADSGATWAGDNDPRITRVGRFLRSSRLDEIPQLWNVLKGDMSLVGPRPERPEFVGPLTQAIPHYQFRHVVRPGLTGWAQVRYKYANTLEDSKQKLQFDLFYIKNISVGLDLLILFETIKTVVIGRGAR
jgi:sugar transferase (PEP-CTERM system associated)